MAKRRDKEKEFGNSIHNVFRRIKSLTLEEAWAKLREARAIKADALEASFLKEIEYARRIKEAFFDVARYKDADLETCAKCFSRIQQLGFINLHHKASRSIMWASCLVEHGELQGAVELLEALVKEITGDLRLSKIDLEDTRRILKRIKETGAME